jgi:predicted DNA binding protein
MNVKQVLSELESNTMNDVAKTIGISSSALQRRLKKVGYVWNASLRKYTWPHDEPEPFNHDIGILSPGGQVGQATHVKQTRNEEEAITYTTGGRFSFTDEEMDTLREMIQAWKERDESKPYEATDSGSLYERVLAIQKEKKKRKTIVINQSVADRFDQFAHDKKVDKQDMIELALIDFMERYQ